MNSEIYLTSNHPNYIITKNREYDVASITAAIEKVGYKTRIVSTADMITHPTDIPFAAVNFTGWTCDTHYQYLRELELLGVRLANSPAKARIADNKMLSYIECKHAGVAVPTTFNIDSSWLDRWNSIVTRVDNEIGYPCVVKVHNGARGIGVYLVPTSQDLNNLIGLLHRCVLNLGSSQMSTGLLVQKYVLESAGKVVRVLVINDKCIAAAIRSNTQSWKAGPVWQNSRWEESEERTPYPIDRGLEKTSVRVCRALNLNFACIDFFIGKDGYILNEIGTAPDLKSFDVCNQISSYEYLIDYLVKQPANS